jgi:hypothetical protein
MMESIELQAFEIVKQHLSEVELSVGKNVALFVGQSQSGKSTTINALLGMPFQWKPILGHPTSYEFCAIPVQGTFAGIGTGAAAQTVIPAVYIGPSDFCLVDSRGAGEIGSDSDPAGILASGILTEMICRNAASVRIVVVSEYQSLENMNSICPFMEFLGTLLNDPTDSVLWLFNRHHRNRGKKSGCWFDQKRSSEVLFDITAKIDKHLNELTSFFSRLKSLGSQKGKKTQVQAIAINSLAKARASTPSRIGYIDPTSTWSVNQVMTQIMGVPPINVDRLKFREASEHRAIFDKYIEQLLVPETRLLAFYPFFASYNVNSIISCTLSSVGVADNLTTVDMSMIERERSRLQREIDGMTGKPVLRYHDRIRWSPSLFRWRWTHYTRYPSWKWDIPYRRYEWDLARGNLIGVDNDHTLQICLKFRSNWFEACEADVRFWINSEDVPSTKLMIDDRKAQINALQSGADLVKVHSDILSQMEVRRRDGRYNPLKQIVRALWPPGIESKEDPPIVREFIAAIALCEKLEAAKNPGRDIQSDEFSALLMKAAEWEAR